MRDVIKTQTAAGRKSRSLAISNGKNQSSTLRGSVSNVTDSFSSLDGYSKAPPHHRCSGADDSTYAKTGYERFLAAMALFAESHLLICLVDLGVVEDEACGWLLMFLLGAYRAKRRTSKDAGEELFPAIRTGEHGRVAR